MQDYSDIELINSIKNGFGFSTDVELAAFLGVSGGNINLVRNHNGKLGPIAKIKCLDRLAFLGVRNWVERISTKYIAERLNEMSKEQARNIAHSKLIIELNSISDESLPDRLRVALGINSDQELANLLGIKRHTISMVRSGKSKLGHIPRLKILEIVEGLPAVEILKAISDNQLLINLLLKHE